MKDTTDTKGTTIKSTTITYLIGNGFDLGLGLKTGYRDFVKWYREQKLEDSDNVRWLKEQMAGENIKWWGDAEMAFGKLSFSEQEKAAKVQAEQVYNECYGDFVNAFIQHLKTENNNFNEAFEVSSQSQQEVARQFLKNVLGLDAFMPDKARSNYLGKLNEMSVEVNFIVFNYTDTVEKILGFDGQPTTYTIDLGTGKAYKVVVQKICHVHGTLGRDFLLGVDNDKQIADSKIRKVCEDKGGIIKPRKDERLGLGNRQPGLDLIKDSDLLVVFGLSYGETDLSWWCAVWDKIFSDRRSSTLIVCPYMDKPAWLGQEAFIYEQETKKIFRSVSKPMKLRKLTRADFRQITLLRPQYVRDSQGVEQPCDYWHLADLRRKYTKDDGYLKSTDPHPGETMTVALPGGAEMTFCWCPATTSEDWKKISGGKDFFWMGSPEGELGRSEDEKCHQVKLTKGFWITQTAVTQRQYESVMAQNPTRHDVGADNPVSDVTQGNCEDFCRRLETWLNDGAHFALPTEAQWEYACRAGTTAALNNGKNLMTKDGVCHNLSEVAWYGKNSSGDKQPVKGKKGNKWNLHDMHGNVWEWCADWYGAYGGDATDPTGAASGSCRVLRGGSYVSPAQSCRSAHRRKSEKESDHIVGFRLCYQSETQG